MIDWGDLLAFPTIPTNRQLPHLSGPRRDFPFFVLGIRPFLLCRAALRKEQYSSCHDIAGITGLILSGGDG